jgi:hypothetical protein
MFKVKEYKEESSDDGKVIWTTEKVEKILKAMEEGYQPTDHPFYEGDPNYKKGNIVFEYTDWEYEEIKKCAKDIIHFANTYCTVMTDDGYMKISLRPYQERVLRSYQLNRWNIFLAPRQIGKCALYTTKIKIRNKKTKEEADVCIGDFYYSKIKPSFLGRIKMMLYKLIENLEK